uniref:Uncharacterized protein n=1 Tax=Triticum urartu TaxID=4572 RepID=A0A8R7QWS6_TRIUA
MQREKRKRGHEATPRETRIIQREKRKRDQEASRGPLLSSAISRQTRMRERLRERMAQFKEATDRCKKEFEERFGGPPDQPVSSGVLKRSHLVPQMSFAVICWLPRLSRLLYMMVTSCYLHARV